MPSLTRLDRPRFAEVARQANNFVADFRSPPIPILDIAEQNGVEVIFINFDLFDDEIAGFCDFEAEKLYVNQSDPVNRQVFTMAHEFGHWILHRTFYLQHPEEYPFLPRFQTPDRTNPFEIEANFFAANVLVPRHLLDPIKDAPIAGLCKAFKVSREMMEIRLQNVRR